MTTAISTPCRDVHSEPRRSDAGVSRGSTASRQHLHVITTRSCTVFRARSARCVRRDNVSIDVGVGYKGFFTEFVHNCRGRVDRREERAAAGGTVQALEAGIAAAHVGNHIGDIGAAVQMVVENAGFSVVRDLVGHGIGVEFHEEPQVPNYGKAKRREKLVPGLTLAIEPMVNVGGPATRTLPDRWTIVTADGSVRALRAPVASTEEDRESNATSHPERSEVRREGN